MASGIDDDTAWAAMLAHDARYDGRFVYAVASTKIYCRPTCPARRPTRSHVLFFDSPEDADSAGYRACRRCHPQMVRPTPTASAVARVRERLDAHITARSEAALTLTDLAREVGLSPFHLQRSFRRVVGVTPKQYLAAGRAKQLKQQLQAGGTVSQAIFEAGYSTSSRVYDAAATHLGMTPATYRRGGQGVDILYTIVPSPMGQLLVAATKRGVCAVSLGDDEATLEAALGHEFPNARRTRSLELTPWVHAIVQFLTGEDHTSSIPLDLDGTAFQLRVWQALRTIPYGETQSYAQIAAALGNPSASRAVARACASNRIALVIPCHRVVRSDGTVSGYRWGKERKQALLEQERTGRRADPPLPKGSNR